MNSISDTTESLQVAKIVRQTFYDIAATADIPEHYDFFELTASGDNTKPTVMYRSADANNIMWMKYDCQTDADPVVRYEDVFYKEPKEFFDEMYRLKSSSSNVGTFTLTVGTDTLPVYYTNDYRPRWWTSIDDYTVLFDSYDSEVDTTLQKNKTLCYGLKSVPFTMSDSFTPDLDEQHFALLLNEAKALAWMELKQQVHEKAEKKSRRQRIQMERSKLALPDNIKTFNQLPNYGRRR